MGIRVTQFAPLDVWLDRKNAESFPQFTHRLLAQGDSWFSFGSLPPGKTRSLLMPLELAKDTAVVNCAHPGDVLTHMVDNRRAPLFVGLLTGNMRRDWDGILLSPGGNDLIDFISTPSTDQQGQPVPRSLRALLTPNERGNPQTAAGFISEDGWQTFVDHIVPQYHEFAALRDAGECRAGGRIPIFVHTYDFITPRNAGAGLNLGPWLFPALNTLYQVPPAFWPELTRLFLGRLKALMLQLGLPDFHVIDTQGTLTPAATGSNDSSNDWANEIHPNPGGYAKLAPVFAAGIDPVLP